MVTSYALVVPLRHAEAARQWAQSAGIARTDLKVGRRPGFLVIPVREPVEAAFEGATVEVADFEEGGNVRSYKDVLRIADSLRPLLPSSFDVVGDLALIKVPEPLKGHAEEIGRAILAAHANLKGVFHDEGVQGPLRLRTLRHLAGEDRTRTIHAEFGARLHVDLRTAYFSPRLANEHHRVASLVQPGERFLDATCGVGPFTILAARRRAAREHVAIDLNRAALDLLRENLRLNRLENVRVLEGDATERLRDVEPANRIVINLPHGGQPLLDAALSSAAPQATIHHYTILPQEGLEAAGGRLVEEASRRTGRPARLTRARLVHPYSPTDGMVSLDLSL